jgi:hypothetical protein
LDLQLPGDLTQDIITFVMEAYVPPELRLWIRIENEMIEFKNMRVMESVVFEPDDGRANTPRSITIKNCSFAKRCEFTGFKEVQLYDSNFESSANLHHSNLYLIDACTFGDLLIDTQNCKELKLTDNIVADKLAITGHYSSFALLDTNTCRQLLLYGLLIKVSMQLIAITAEECSMEACEAFSWTFDSCNIESLRIETCFKLRELQFLGNTLKHVYFDGMSAPHCSLTNCETVEIILPLHSVSDFFLNGGSCQKMLLAGKLNQSAACRIEETKLQELELKNIKNDGKIELIGLQNGAKLSVQSSDLGRTDFIRCNFQNAIFDFNNSKMSEIFIAQSTFPKFVQTDGELNYEQSRLAFAQFHSAYQKMGDTVNSLECQSRELEAHYHLTPWRYFFTKLNLFLNKISNDFGRNWGRGVGFIFISSAVLFYFFVLSTEQFYFDSTLKFDARLIPSFLNFINPLRFYETDEIFRRADLNLKLTIASFVFDFISRIVLAYGFYQTIQAFRRYGRK